MTVLESEQLPDSDDAAIRKTLSSYAIGLKLRNLRVRRKIALVDLGRQTGLSASMLSQLENSKLIPTLPTLVRIASVFDVGLEYFFAERKHERPLTIVRREDRVRPSGDLSPNYFFDCLSSANSDRPVQIHIVDFAPVAEGEMEERSHEGTEFLYLIAGGLTIRYGAEEYQLSAGDSVCFDSSTRHACRGTNGEPARALIVKVAPGI